MKTKTKLVLALSVLSAATLAAGATSTFAWWQVGASGTATKTAAQTVSAAKAVPSAVSGLEFELDIDIKYVGSKTTSETAPTAADEMEMVTYIASADVATVGHGAAAGKNFGYYTTTGTDNYHFVQTQFDSTKDYYRIYKFVASIPTSQTKSSVTYSQDEIFQAIGGSSTKFKMTATITGHSGSRIKFYQGAAVKAEPTAPGVNTDFKFADNLSFEAKGSSITGYLGVYVEGHGTNDGNSASANAPDASFTVTVAKA